MTDWTEKEIRAQLGRIVASQEFADSSRLSQFLTYVVEQALQESTGRTTQYEIAVEGLGYTSDFDPASNPSVRIMARRLRRALKHYYAHSGVPDPIRVKLPKGGYTPVFVDPLEESTTDASEDTPAVPEAGLVEIAEPSIAVFELEMLSHGENDTTIATGLTSELLFALTRFVGISVIGPLSIESHPPLHWREIYREYGALFALKGRIQTQNQIIRINMELVETRTGRGQWARRFEYDLDKASLFDIQDEIAGLVSGTIADGSGMVFRKMHAESYSKYITISDVTRAVLCYNKAWVSHGPDDWQRAFLEVGEALARNPDNALLNALQANIHYTDALHDLGLDPETHGKMQSLAKKAIALDPTLQVAQYNLAVINAFFGNAEACVRAAQKAVAMNPNHAMILAGSAVATTSVGAYELGMELIERARQLNPHYPGWYFFIDFVIHMHNGQFEQAWEDAQLIRTPGILWQPIIRAAALGKLGRAEEAQPYLEELLQIQPDFLQRPRDSIRRLFVTDEHVDMIWDGLRRAGISP